MKNNINRLLLIIASVIVLGTIFGTAVALNSTKAVPGKGLRKIEKINRHAAGTSFDLIGLLRISTRGQDENSRHVMVLTPWLEYDENDQALYEELDRKLVSIKAVINTYFSTRTKEELLEMNEDTIKEELLQQINGLLVLGKVKKIYFKDFMFLN